MATQTELLVIGAGPYGLSVAALAEEQGIGTMVLGRPMGFWQENMPAGMFLRSGPDWHLDAAGIHTLEAFLEERRIQPAAVDPIPVGVFLEYAQWFQDAKKIRVSEGLVESLAKSDGRFEAALDSGERIEADAVVAAPGIAPYLNLPDWASSLPQGSAAHTCNLVRFEEMAGARVLVVGGRQSAYEWAALIHEHGAARVDIVHRHDVPRFERVSWKFADPHVEQTIAVPGYWRNLPPAEQDAITRQFWEVGRLTLEYWLTPRLDRSDIFRWPGTEVTEAAPSSHGEQGIQLSNSTSLTVDKVVFASGYRADLTAVPYLAGVLGDVRLSNGFPMLDEAFQTSLDGLYVTGFSATQDFGPFFGFVKGSPAAATLVVRDLLSRA
jgi:cation diffusion facilitator CzcD-associated flavoprotein CzcO